jgi:hypothetical protein
MGAIHLYKDYEATFKVTQLIAVQDRQHAQQPVNKENLARRLALIKALDAEGIKALIPEQPHTIAQNDAQFLQLLKEVRLTDLLGVRAGQTFNCILPEHGDSTPSANISIGKDGLQWYKCFGCEANYLANYLIEVVAGCTIQEAKDFLGAVFNIELRKSDWLIAIEQMYENNKERLLFDLKDNCPTAYGYVRNDIPALIVMHDLAKKHASGEHIALNGYPVFYAGRRQIAMKLEPHRYKDDSGKYIELQDKKYSKKVNNINALGFVQKLELNQLPSARQADIKQYQDNNGYSKHINPWIIPEYNATNLRQIEQKAKRLKANHYTKQGLSKEYMQRTFEDAEAKRLYPQESTYINPEHNELTLAIGDAIQAEIEAKGYSTEKPIIEKLKTLEGQYAYKVQTQIKRSLPQLLDTFGWKRVKCNAELKAQYNVDSAGWPYIIIPA